MFQPRSASAKAAGANFTARRRWARHCWSRCRQQAYLERRIAAAAETRLGTGTAP